MYSGLAGFPLSSGLLPFLLDSPRTLEQTSHWPYTLGQLNTPSLMFTLPIVPEQLPHAPSGQLSTHLAEQLPLPSVTPSRVPLFSHLDGRSWCPPDPPEVHPHSVGIDLRVKCERNVTKSSDLKFGIDRILNRPPDDHSDTDDDSIHDAG